MPNNKEQTSDDSGKVKKTEKRKMSKLERITNTFLLVAGLAVPTTLIVGFEDQEGARETLENADYVVTEVGGKDYFSCGNGDIYRTHFKALNQKGKEVEGTVCKGLFKGSTIRFD